MKIKMKLLGVFLLTLVLGINTLSVRAYDPEDDSVCGEGQILHTNYYLFLDTNARSSLMSYTNNGTVRWTHYTGAPKYNNIHDLIVPNTLIKARNDIKITDGNRSNFSEESTSIEWTIVEYWEHYYATEHDIKEGAKSPNKTYDENIRTTYFLHNGAWWSYTSDSDETGTVQTGNGSSTKGLYAYLKNNITNLAASDLVKKGTVLPITKIEPRSLDASIESSSYFFRVSRDYTPESLTGDNYNATRGFTLDSTTDRTFGPGAYYVQFCIEANAKTIQYKQNYEGEAPVDMPEDQTFSSTCTEVGEGISSLIPKREGYEFLGWNTDKDADKPAMVEITDEDNNTVSVQKYAPGNQYCGNSIVLYAIWKEKTPEDGPFTVTYDANGGTNAPAPQNGDTSTNTCVKISDKGKMTLTKNKFLGWSTKEDAPEADSKYAPGKEYCGENGDLTLYAVWSADTGVSAHVIAFGIVTVAAIGALVVAKKKNLFKQI